MQTRLVLGLSLALSCSAAFAEFVGKGDTTVDTSSNLEWLDLSFSRGLTWQEVTTMPAFAGWRHATAAEAAAVFVQFGIPLATLVTYRRVAGDLSSGPAAFEIASGLLDWQALFNTVHPATGTNIFTAMIADVFPDSGDIHPVLSAYASTFGGLYESGATVYTVPPVPGGPIELEYAHGQYAVWGDCCTVGIGESNSTTQYFGRFYDHFLVRSAGLTALGPPVIPPSHHATPVPEPETYALMLFGLAAIGARRWRRR